MAGAVQTLAPLLLNLATGTALSLAAQHVTDMDVAADEVQALAWTKYVATVAFTAIQPGSRTGFKAMGKGSEQLSSRARMLMVVIGVLDLVGYATHCIGFALCGAATAAIVFAAAGQTFTALMTRFVLGRKLTRGQQAAVGLVLLGILMRGGTAGGSAQNDQPPRQRLGYAALLISTFCYSCLGVVYDVLVSSEDPAPSHARIMSFAGKIGLAATTAYQVGFTLPRWGHLVDSHLRAGGTSPWAAIGALAAFGAVFVGHTFAQGAIQRSDGALAMGLVIAGVVQRRDGALAVGLVNAVRSATVSVGTSLLFCSPKTPWQCLTPRKAASAGVVTLGGIVWVLSKERQGKEAAPGKKKD